MKTVILISLANNPVIVVQFSTIGKYANRNRHQSTISLIRCIRTGWDTRYTSLVGLYPDVFALYPTESKRNRIWRSGWRHDARYGNDRKSRIVTRDLAIVIYVPYPCYQSVVINTFHSNVTLFYVHLARLRILFLQPQAQQVGVLVLKRSWVKKETKWWRW